MTTSVQRFDVNASWLIKLRWVAVIGQVITILTVTNVFAIEIKMLWALFVVIGVTILSNLLLSVWYQAQSASQTLEQPSNLVLGMVMVLSLIHI